VEIKKQKLLSMLQDVQPEQSVTVDEKPEEDEYNIEDDLNGTKCRAPLKEVGLVIKI